MAGKIFVNYRREDDPGFVHAIFQRLEAEFGRQQLFMDVEGYINAGDDFVSILDGQVAECAVLLVVIGPRWLEIKDQAGHRRLDNEDDFVRVEIASGLRREKRVIPVLVNNARMPSSALLPDELRPLARRHAVRLSHERFVSDCQGLAREIRGALANAKAPQPTIDLSRMRPQKPRKGQVSSHTMVAGAGSPRLAQLGKHPLQPGPEATK
jgi:hypothetical protein